MRDFAGSDQFSIKTRGVETVVSENKRVEELDKAVDEYKGEHFELKAGSRATGETPSAIVVKKRLLRGPIERKLEVDMYGELLDEEISPK